MNRAFDHEDEFNSWGGQDDLDGQNPPAGQHTGPRRHPDRRYAARPRRPRATILPDLRPETPVDRPVYELNLSPGTDPRRRIATRRTSL